MELRRLFAACAPIVLMLAACAADVPDARFGDVQELVEQRTGRTLVWRQDADADRQAQDAVRTLLQDDLTLEEAVQVALLDNPGQQAVYEELGIAQADLVHAGLLGNPIFGGHLRWPDSPPRAPNIELNVMQPFLDLFVRPARERMAQAEVDAAVLRVADAALALQGEVGAAYVRYQAALQGQGQLRQGAQAAELAGELARRQREAGNISELDATLLFAAARQAGLELLLAEGDVAERREQLARLLGPVASSTDWRVPPALPAPPGDEPPLDALLARSAQRLDVQAARRALESQRRQIEDTAGAWATDLGLGLSWEQDPDGQQVFGPAWELELPFGGQRRATLLRLSAEERQSRRRLEQLEQQAASDVRLAWSRARSARAVHDGYARELAPLEARVVELSQQHYDGMLIGPFALLQARQNQMLTERQSIEALAGLWLARLDLERAAGGTLDPAAAPASEPTPPAPRSSEEPEHAGHH